MGEFILKMIIKIVGVLFMYFAYLLFRGKPGFMGGSFDPLCTAKKPLRISVGLVFLAIGAYASFVYFRMP